MASDDHLLSREDCRTAKEAGFVIEHVQEVVDTRGGVTNLAALDLPVRGDSDSPIPALPQPATATSQRYLAGRP